MIAIIYGRIPLLWLAGLLALLAIGVLAAAPPPWVVRTWQSDEGLPDNTVVGIEQTPDGFLWVATKTGLLRFDGVRFQPFQATAAGRRRARSRRCWPTGVVTCGLPRIMAWCSAWIRG